jgi:hypothetical protein
MDCPQILLSLLFGKQFHFYKIQLRKNMDLLKDDNSQ